MGDTLPELERIQTQILQRISNLEISSASLLPQPASTPSPTQNDEARLSSILKSKCVNDFAFKTVAADYYDWPLESRRDAVGAASVHHLCKSIVLVNTQAIPSVVDCSDRNNSKYYLVVVQYTARFNAKAVKNFLYTLNEGKIAKKKFNLRLAPEETSTQLTGFGHMYWHENRNSVSFHATLSSSKQAPDVWEPSVDNLKSYQQAMEQVILDEAIQKLNPDFFWLGGGEVYLKLGIRTSEFINVVKPFVVSCSGSN